MADEAREAFDRWWDSIEWNDVRAEYTYQGQALQAFRAGWEAAKAAHGG